MSAETDNTKTGLEVTRARWERPTVTKAGHVADLVQILKLSGGTDCSGTRRYNNEIPTSGQHC